MPSLLSLGQPGKDTGLPSAHGEEGQECTPTMESCSLSRPGSRPGAGNSGHDHAGGTAADAEQDLLSWGSVFTKPPSRQRGEGEVRHISAGKALQDGKGTELESWEPLPQQKQRQQGRQEKEAAEAEYLAASNADWLAHQVGHLWGAVCVYMCAQVLLMSLLLHNSVSALCQTQCLVIEGSEEINVCCLVYQSRRWILVHLLHWT